MNIEIVVISVLILVAGFIIVKFIKASKKKAGKSNGSVNMPEPYDNNEGEQNQ